jgi:L-ascorbate metabolism protein UlaG (beta-lactamase superfamily)
MKHPRSDHFDGRRFFNPGVVVERGFVDLLRWRRTSRAVPWPKDVPVAPAALPPPPTGDGLAVTWIGHATFLLQTAASAWLTDPVFSDRIGPVEGFGPRRAAPPAFRPGDLPKIDGILLSHDHFDHCDIPSLRALGRKARADGTEPLVVAPLNYGFLGKIGRPDSAGLVELDWWQEVEGPGGSAIRFVPAQHWCRRHFLKTNIRLWGGFFVTAGGRSLYFAGDSGYHPGLFAEIRRRCGTPDVALLPIGAYEPRWFMAPAHMNPAEAVRAHLDLGARRSIAMHWGTFQLTDEGREAPVRALEAARREAGVSAEEFRALPIGGTAAI